MGISPRQLYLGETSQWSTASCRWTASATAPNICYKWYALPWRMKWKKKKNIKINHFSKSLPSFSTSLFPFQQWEERKIKAGIWPLDRLEPFESFEDFLKFTVRPEHEVLAIPSLRAKDLALVVFLTVAVYDTPARIAILWEKCTSNVLMLELV